MSVHDEPDRPADLAALVAAIDLLIAENPLAWDPDGRELSYSWVTGNQLLERRWMSSTAAPLEEWDGQRLSTAVKRAIKAGLVVETREPGMVGGGRWKRAWTTTARHAEIERELALSDYERGMRRVNQMRAHAAEGMPVNGESVARSSDDPERWSIHRSFPGWREMVDAGELIHIGDEQRYGTNATPPRLVLAEHEQQYREARERRDRSERARIERYERARSAVAAATPERRSGEYVNVPIEVIEQLVAACHLPAAVPS